MFRKPQQQRPPAIADDIKEQEQGARSGQTSTYSCPDCGGVLWQFDDKSLPHFACHVGHRYGPDELVVAKSRALEQALYEAVRGLREKGTLLRQLAVKASPTSAATAYLIEQADQDDEHARLIESRLLDGSTVDSSIDTSADVIGEFVREMRRPSDD